MLMSDLHCPARLLVVRHGEADYAAGTDVLNADGGWLTDRGREQARTLAETLRGERVAVVYASALQRATETGQLIADALGVPLRPRPALVELAIGDLAGQAPATVDEYLERWRRGELDLRIPGGESGQQVLDRVAAGLDEIADLHRGETVVVVTHGGVMGLCLPRLVVNPGRLREEPIPLANCALVALEQDADGWRLIRPWPEG